MTYHFLFDLRLMCEEYFDPVLAGKDHDKALEFAKNALKPLFSSNAEYERDLASRMSRITVNVIFLGFDRLDRSPDQAANYMARVSSDDLSLLWFVRQNVADEWNDGNVADYPICQIVEGFGT